MEIAALPELRPLQRGMVLLPPAKPGAPDPVQGVAPGDIVVLERRTIAARTLLRLAEQLAERGASALVVHRSILDSLATADRGALEARLVVLAMEGDWKGTAQRLLTPGVPATFPSKPREALQAVLRGHPVDGELPQILDGEEPIRALAIVARPDERVPLSLSKLEEVLAGEAISRDPRAEAVTVDGVVAGITRDLDDEDEREVRALAEAVLHRARSALLLSDVTVGVGRSYRGSDGLHRSYREAVWAALVAEKLSEDGRVVTFRQLGIFRMMEPFLSDGLGSDTEEIERLLEYDRQNHTALLPTVETFCDSGRSGDAAASLYVHRNTIAYRLRAVKRVTGLDLRDPDSRLLLEVQLRLARLQGVLPSKSEQHSATAPLRSRRGRR
ncbi:MAG: helix-turn-helix domain-containing protein [Actinomycetota bacterium]|nr:helix-turn-helix domain-containing protein [Actinomycetota bacterium]